VLAPISGKVHDVENAQPDNVPGEVPPTATLGNFVIIEAAETEFAFLAHLKQDSVTVAPGDTVVAGQVIAACGNSGRSLEPHLHFHAQNSANFPYAESLPIVFANIQVGDERISSGMPHGSTDWNEPNGQRVRQLD
jgi:murein DD-endopeptidase MepM/ murein hydrolase activator NlpD